MCKAADASLQGMFSRGCSDLRCGTMCTFDLLTLPHHVHRSKNQQTDLYMYSFSFIQTISISPLQVLYYSGVLPIQHGYCAGISRRNATGNCELKTCPKSLLGG